MTIAIPIPELQVSFALALSEIRGAMLQEALRTTIMELKVPAIDKQLAKYVPAHAIAVLAGHGLRGELVFPVPVLLTANPRLLGYYRLLYGYSQKEFYNGSVAGRFRAMEVRGKLTAKNAGELSDLCEAMAEAGAFLLAGISAGKVNAAVLDDLTLLTLGPQFRGGANVRIGGAGIAAVFGAIKDIVSADQHQIKLLNAANRTVVIEFAADPDIIIRENMREDSYRLLIAIEVKGGRDFSNVHNRIGEAEKSHQKARLAGYTECWTVVNVDKINTKVAKQESPSTDRFYRMSDIVSAGNKPYSDFRDRIVSLTGIRT